jgi:hypothetical protein
MLRYPLRVLNVDKLWQNRQVHPSTSARGSFSSLNFRFVQFSPRILSSHQNSPPSMLDSHITLLPSHLPPLVPSGAIAAATTAPCHQACPAGPAAASHPCGSPRAPILPPPHTAPGKACLPTLMVVSCPLQLPV